MRVAVLLFCLALAACMERPPFGDTRTEAPPPEPVWQRGPAGWVYGRSPFDLWPEGWGNEIVRLPTAVTFRSGSAVLDSMGHDVVVLQALRLRQVPNLAVTLFCGWSPAEVADAAAGRRLAAARCAAVVELYRGLGVPTRALHRRLVVPASAQPASAEQDETWRNVTVTAVPTGRTSFELPLPVARYNRLMSYSPSNLRDFLSGYFEITYPAVFSFSPNSVALDANTKRLLDTTADLLMPYGPTFFIFLVCEEFEGEIGADEEERPLARKRCAAVKDYLAAKGFCSWRILANIRLWTSKLGQIRSKQGEPLVVLSYAVGDAGGDTSPPCTAGSKD